MRVSASIGALAEMMLVLAAARRSESRDEGAGLPESQVASAETRGSAREPGDAARRGIGGGGGESWFLTA